jgi:hypothetical protein
MNTHVCVELRSHSKTTIALERHKPSYNKEYLDVLSPRLEIS